MHRPTRGEGLTAEDAEEERIRLGLCDLSVLCGSAGWKEMLMDRSSAVSQFWLQGKRLLVRGHIDQNAQWIGEG